MLQRYNIFCKYYAKIGVFFARGTLQSSINPNPFFIRRGFEPPPKPLANRWQGDVIDSGGDHLHQGFGMALEPVPFGGKTPQGSPYLLTSPLTPPLAKGLNKKQADPLIGRAYLNERATGGAVASSPYRGRPWRGWMFLCFFLCAKESKEYRFEEWFESPHVNLTR